MINQKSFLFSCGVITTILLTQPAYAVIYDWQFDNENGFGDQTQVVSGFLEFAATSFSDLAGNSNVSAIDFQINSVSNLPVDDQIFIGDGRIEFNTNLVGISDINQWNFDNSGNNTLPIITGLHFLIDDRSTASPLAEGILIRESFSGVLTRESPRTEYLDSDSSTLTFTQKTTSVSVPFEFSPTLGILVVGSLFMSSCLSKHLINRYFS